MSAALDVLAGRGQWAVEQGDCLSVLRGLPDASVQVCACSPPYYGLRAYLPADHPDKGLEVGTEPTLAEYVERLVLIFREVKRVLHPTGTLWCNLADSYATNPGNGRGGEGVRRLLPLSGGVPHRSGRDRRGEAKPKDLLMVPARVALALQDDGWWLRSDIAWVKTAAMPESVTDRPTSAWEHVFLLSKRATYYYDAEAVKESAVSDHPSGNGYARPERLSVGGRGQEAPWVPPVDGKRNLRNYWLLGPEPLASDHYAAWPTEIPRRAILAGSRPGDVVLDPFSGSGRTGIVALRLGRRYAGIELSGYQADKSRARIEADCPMFNQPTEGAAG